MGASASRHATGKASSSRSDGSHSERLAKSTSGAAVPHERGTRGNSRNPNFLAQHRNSSSADESAAARVTQQQQQIFHQHQQQRSRQQSIWSLGSLSGPSDWSSTGVAARNSFRNRNKTTSGKSSYALQQRRSKTVWHRPLTDVIFSSHFKPNSRNEHFHVERLIAKGAFGVVFKVIDKRALQAQQLQQAAAHTERITNGGSRYPANATAFALKVLKKSKIIEQNSVQQIKDEADIQKLCGHHPFIVQQIDLWQNRRNLHILSEYVPNGELFSTIATFSLELIRLYIAEIALAIDFLHNAGIIYRDAKPENILLTETYHIKLTDFGLSKWLSLGSTTSTMCGTLQYMAPEIVRGERYGHAADWWSLGVIACQMFALECPDVQQFLDAPLAPKTDAAAVDVTDELPPPPSPPSTDTPPAPLRGATGALAAGSFLPATVDSLPHAAKDVIQRLLQLEPQKRLRSVLALQRIAFYHNYSVDAHHLLSISPLDIIRSDRLVISKRRLDPEDASDVATKAFECF